MKNDSNKSHVLTLRVTEAEKTIINKLKGKYSINISQFIRNKILELNDNIIREKTDNANKRR